MGDFALAFSCLSLNLRFVWDAVVDEGYVIRGAVELDQIFWSDNELIGPALVRAYDLERSCAKTARVTREGPLIFDIPDDSTGLRLVMKGTEDSLDLGF